jgi:hypothetical protein
LTEHENENTVNLTGRLSTASKYEILLAIKLGARVSTTYEELVSEGAVSVAPSGHLALTPEGEAWLEEESVRIRNAAHKWIRNLKP